MKMTWRQMNAFFQGRPMRVWSPLIGSRFAARLAPLATLFFGGALVMLAGWISMFILIGSSRDDPSMVIAGFIVGGVGVSAWATPYVLIDRLGARMGDALRHAGVTVDRRPPIHSPYLYAKWLKRNELTADRVCATLDGVPAG